ncbi:MAG: hypothetical protein K8R49_05380 [Candidatus Cloacimonetes bacterium]|nr:hypothetical protein [Candidatus Cloacimonadota bacterium]
MKRITLLACLLIILFSNLLSVEVILINKKLIAGSLIKHKKKIVYLSKDDTLYVISEDAIQNIDYARNEIDQPDLRINYNSYQKIYKINRKNIWTHELFNKAKIKSFVMNNEVIAFKFQKLMKIQLVSGDTVFGRFYKDSEHNIQIISDSLIFYPKRDISKIWLRTELKKNGINLGGFIGLLLGMSVGATIAQLEGYDDGKDAKFIHPVIAGPIIGWLIGASFGYCIGWVFDKEQLVWSRN